MKLRTSCAARSLKMLLREKKISKDLLVKLLSWKNPDFNIHKQVKI